MSDKQFNQLSTEAQETARAMIEYCLNACVRLGMDEGFNEDGSPNALRRELQDFVGFDSAKST